MITKNEPPNNDLQALYVSSSAKRELKQAVKDTFGRGIWVDPTRNNKLILRVTDTPDLPPLAGWHYHVAYHLVLRVKAENAQRHAQERRFGMMLDTTPDTSFNPDELRAVLDQEFAKREELALPRVKLSPG